MSKSKFVQKKFYSTVNTTLSISYKIWIGSYKMYVTLWGWHMTYIKTYQTTHDIWCFILYKVQLSKWQMRMRYHKQQLNAEVSQSLPDIGHVITHNISNVVLHCHVSMSWHVSYCPIKIVLFESIVWHLKRPQSATHDI